MNQLFCTLAALWIAGSAAHAGDWSEVDRAVRLAHESAGGAALALRVHDGQGRLLHQSTLGGFDAAQPLPVASASKLVASLLILDAVERGELSLDSTTGGVLGWTGDRATITLRQLLAQVSGLQPHPRCLNDAATTLARCVEFIAADVGAMTTRPGQRFEYGGSHHQVAARMLEVATGRLWQDLFAERIASPLGLARSTRFHTAPWADTSEHTITNPRVAGGLVASLDDYSRLMTRAYERAGRSSGVYAELGTAPHPGAEAVGSPMARATGRPFPYGLGVWLECGERSSGCEVLSSAGAFGWTPWLDRRAGYHAVIAAYRPVAPGDGGLHVVAWSVGLQQRLKPLIEAALEQQQLPPPK
jgi:CubicO group peptidase (beta-lactamase class C family)